MYFFCLILRIDNTGKFYLLLANSYTESRPFLLPMLPCQRIGWGSTRNWEGTQQFQLTPTYQRNIPYRMTSCSTIKLGGVVDSDQLLGDWLGISQSVLSNFFHLHHLFFLGFIFLCALFCYFLNLKKKKKGFYCNTLCFFHTFTLPVLPPIPLSTGEE